MEADSQLIARYLAKKDELALETLVRRHLSGVYSFVRRYNADEDTVSDIVQESFVKAWKNLKRFDSKKNFRSWLLAIAKNTALDHLKRKAALPLSAFEDDGFDTAELAVDAAPSVLEQLIGRQSEQELALAIAQLPAPHRSVVAMHVTDGLRFREIAQALGQPLNTVKSHYRRGIVALRRLVMHQK